jgi:malonyl-CoA O-methyltransferase
MAEISCMSAPGRVDGRRVRHNFSSHAGDYDRYARVQKRVAGRLVELLRERGPFCGPALEVGTGTGRLAQSLAEVFPDIRPVLSDIAHDMTRLALHRVPRATGFDADAQALPLRSNRFSLVCSSSVYQWMNSLAAAFAESYRVLAPGGVFAFALFGERTLFELRDSHRRAVAECGECRASHAQEFPDPGRVRQSLEAVGFDRIRTLSEDEVEYHADVPALLRGLKAIGAQNAARNRPAGMASRRIMARMTEIYRQNYEQGRGLPATYQVVYGLARKPIER